MPLSEPVYPVNLVVAGKPCLVVGGGSVARRKVEALLGCAARVTVVAPDVEDDITNLAPAPTIERRPYRRGDAAGYRLVVAATSDPAVNQQVYEEAEAAGVWVNVADDPAHCTFTLPAVVRRGPITVAVSTGGYSPALAAWLRDRVDGWLGEEYVVLLELLSEVRASIKARGGSTEGLDWLSALDSNMLELIRAGQIGQARERLQACLSSS